MLEIGSVVIRVDDLAAQTNFWCQALDLVPREEESEDFQLLTPRNGIGPNLSLDKVRSSASLPPRIHLDLYSENQAEDVARLVGLGAKRIFWDKQPKDSDYVIMEDPEGNRFCVVQK